MSGGTMAGRAGAVSGPRWAGLIKLVDVLLGLLVAVVVAAGVLTPLVAALDAPEEAGAAAPVAATARGGTEVPAVLPANNILQDAWDWYTDKAAGAGEWLVDKGGAIAGKTGEILHAMTHPVETIQGAAQDWVGSAFEQAVSWVAATLGKASAWLLATILAVVFSVSSPQMDANFLYT